MIRTLYSRNPDRITHLVGEGSYTFIHYLDAKPLLIARPMQTCVEALPSLIRIHKRFAVNPQFLRAVDSHYAEVLVIDKRLPISRRRFKEVLKQLNALGITS